MVVRINYNFRSQNSAIAYLYTTRCIYKHSRINAAMTAKDKFMLISYI